MFRKSSSGGKIKIPGEAGIVSPRKYKWDGETRMAAIDDLIEKRYFVAALDACNEALSAYYREENNSDTCFLEIIKAKIKIINNLTCLVLEPHSVKAYLLTDDPPVSPR